VDATLVLFFVASVVAGKLFDEFLISKFMAVFGSGVASVACVGCCDSSATVVSPAQAGITIKANKSKSTFLMVSPKLVELNCTHLAGN